MAKRRRTYSGAEMRKIFNKTKGYCHFCGDKIVFGNYGKSAYEFGWVVDHIHQIGKGGEDTISNTLPIHPECNRSRGKYKGHHLRYLIKLGQIARTEFKVKKSRVGIAMDKLYEMKKETIKSRRKS